MRLSLHNPAAAHEACTRRALGLPPARRHPADVAVTVAIGLGAVLCVLAMVAVYLEALS